ncbi:hypothetical protein OQA88_9111 [Cercophora sp. LCS_1]
MAHHFEWDPYPDATSTPNYPLSPYSAPDKFAPPNPNEPDHGPVVDDDFYAYGGEHTVSESTSRLVFEHKIQQFLATPAEERLEICGLDADEASILFGVCDDGNPCKQCLTAPGVTGTRCRRGLVDNIVPSSSLFCTAPSSKPSIASSTNVPAALQPALDELANAKTRLKHVHRQLRCSGPRATEKGVTEILHRVITIDIDFSTFNPMPDLVNTRSFPYGGLIIQIVWELTDCPATAQIMGVGVVEQLVALLEAASLCEARFGHWDEEKRLVYISMRCLLQCARTLRLSSLGFLMLDPHGFCTAGECICPGLAGVNKHVSVYVRALTGALFSTKKGKDSSWILMFYSLCIQSHVRRALLSLEQSWQHTGSEVPYQTTAPATSKYLHTAICIFQQISAQKKGSLADQIGQARPAPSLYLGAQLAATGGAWQKWHEEGINGYLERIFQVDDDTRRPSTAIPLGSSGPGATTTPLAGQTGMDWTSGGFPNATSHMAPHPEVSASVPSIYSTTSVADSHPSWTDSVNPSLLSLSTISGGTAYEYFAP